jgi:hypothetical protein
MDFGSRSEMRGQEHLQRLGFKTERTHPHGHSHTKSHTSSSKTSYNEDGKEIHFLTQKLPEAVCTLRYLEPYGCSTLKLQIAQTEQSRMLAVLYGACFEDSKVVPIKGCYTSRMVAACKGLRKDIVYSTGMLDVLRGCFSLDVQSLREAVQRLRDSGVVSKQRIDDLERQAQAASDEVWAEDFRCLLVLARSYIQVALEGKVSPAPEYLTPELADMMNRRVFSRVTKQQRMQNLEMIRMLMKSDLGGQLLPLFRVVFHPDLHTWRVTPKRGGVQPGGPLPHGPLPHHKPREHWRWDLPLEDLPAAASAAQEFRLMPAPTTARTIPGLSYR